MEMRDLSLNEEPTLENAQQAQAEAAPTNDNQEPLASMPDPEAAAEDEMTEAVEEEERVKAATQPLTKALLMEQAKALLEKDGAEIPREQIGRLRQHYASLHQIEIEQQRTAWQEAGNAPEDFKAPECPEDAAFSAMIEELRAKKNAWAAQQEEMRQANLKAKNEIIDKINSLAGDTDNVNRTFPLYRELQDQFNAIGEVPPTDETSVWKRFQEARECYSDNLKINKELRDYDFKKNLDSKLLLIDEAVALDGEQDVLVAFRRLQDLHDKWRQIGPVAKELRDEIWMKFKDASAVINKKYQAFFEERKAREAENEAAKTALCEKIEALDFSALSSFSAWEDMTAAIIALQADWKKLGFAPRKVNNALFARFRKRCDDFFSSKASYFKSVKEEYARNLELKTALAARAEELKESTDWKKATDELVAMQKQWKEIGAVPKKHSDAVWKRFLGACDAFFERKKQANSGQRMAEQANLKAKREIIAALEALAKEEDGVADKMRELQDKWQQTGHVPFRDKDKVNDAYRAAVNALRKSLNANENRRGVERFEANLAQIEGDQSKLSRERERLVRALENRRNEIRTYENNLGFFSSKSKSGESMVKEFESKIERLKADIVSIQEKISLIDSKL